MQIETKFVSEAVSFIIHFLVCVQTLDFLHPIHRILYVQEVLSILSSLFYYESRDT